MTTLADAIATPASVAINASVGRQAAAASKSVALATDDSAALAAIGTKLDTVITSLSTIDGRVDGLEAVLGTATDAAVANGAAGSIDGHLRAIKDGITDTTSSSKVVSGYDEYETVAASSTSQVLGATGGTGDRLSHLLIQPATTSPGSVTLKDGSTTVWTFPGGASSVTTLIPFTVPFGLKSVSGTWNVTTTTNVSVVAAGDFT